MIHLMCGRLNQFEATPAIQAGGRRRPPKRRNTESETPTAQEPRPIHNLCPTDMAQVLRLDEDGELIEEPMRFGLLPAWARGDLAAVSRKFGHTFNARCESVFELASYKAAILQRRALVPVRGWHEWPLTHQPYFIHRRDDQVLWLAAIWECWHAPQTAGSALPRPITSMSVITTAPGAYMAQFHDRSPLVLEDEQAWAWLQPGMNRAAIEAFFRPYDSPLLEAWRVGPSVANPRNKGAEVWAPVATPVEHGAGPVLEDEIQLPLF